ncbi:hypothetical protein D3C84_751730 [compost metagenome]
MFCGECVRAKSRAAGSISRPVTRRPALARRRVNQPVPQPTSSSVEPGVRSRWRRIPRHSVSPIQRPRGLSYQASYSAGVIVHSLSVVEPVWGQPAGSCDLPINLTIIRLREWKSEFSKTCSMNRSPASARRSPAPSVWNCLSCWPRAKRPSKCWLPSCRPTSSSPALI